MMNCEDNFSSSLQQRSVSAVEVGFQCLMNFNKQKFLRCFIVEIIVTSLIRTFYRFK